MAPKSPTHEVTHRKDWQVHLYIAESLQQKLNSTNCSVRDGARQAVCIAFRKACKKKFPSFGIAFIEWHELVLRPLYVSAPQPPSYRSAPVARTPAVNGAVDDEAGREPECDDCPSCDIGYHERCRQPGGCPNASAWLR